MELVRLVAPLAKRANVARLSNEHSLLFRCSDADTVITAASLVDQLTEPLGVWLFVHEGYPAQLAARDVKTLAAIVPLGHVVVESDDCAEDHADALRALLTNGEVNFTNDVVVLTGAYNRPAPPTPIIVWSSNGESLVGEVVVLTKGRIESSDVGVFTYFN